MPPVCSVLAQSSTLTETAEAFTLPVAFKPDAQAGRPGDAIARSALTTTRRALAMAAATLVAACGPAQPPAPICAAPTPRRRAPTVASIARRLHVLERRREHLAR